MKNYKGIVLGIVVTLTLSGCASSGGVYGSPTNALDYASVRPNVVRVCDGQSRQNSWLRSTIDEYGSTEVNERVFNGRRTINKDEGCYTVVHEAAQVPHYINIFRNFILP